MTMPSCTKRGPYRKFVKIGVEELDWPAQSPDLNPIEHLQDELEPVEPAKGKTALDGYLTCLIPFH
jgi:hypothetical protein